jgi:formylmethanofuran dehydrogenase subunit E
MSDISAWDKWKNKNGGNAKPWDLLNPAIKRVDKDVFEYRFKTHCLNCPFLIKATKTCKKCGCFMTQKAQLPNAGCPIGKWGPLAEDSDLAENSEGVV